MADENQVSLSDDAVGALFPNAILAEVIEACCLIVTNSCAEVIPGLTSNSLSDYFDIGLPPKHKTESEKTYAFA